LRNEWVNTQKVESIVQVTPSTMYSLLMNSSKAFNKSCLSLYLSMLPKLALKVTDLVHGSFFGNSNCQTLSICYPGSMEKINFLGAIYWLLLLQSHNAALIW
jgi:hypothetical protein